ncbi:DUF2071 domain-containing protein [Intrasporangium sp.]|jgi:uncharacterized protein YqjF (DUF2071 family)|uniref:YqjF family protein n=1 Tax=Intrasporangium sp. TaxID=1925024 RepID=UPI00336568D8
MAGPRAEQRVTAPVLRTSWLEAGFVHWRVPPPSIDALLPPGLTADVHDGSAWVTLVPHVMWDLRPLGLRLLPDLSQLPGRCLPDLSSAPEINLRTYVRGPEGRDGLWFLSLDVANTAVAAAARAFVGAPYFASRLRIERNGGCVRYAGARAGRPELFDLTIEPGALIEPSERDDWLTGRWLAYTKHLGSLLATPVEHEPWPLRSGTLRSCSESLTAAAGLPSVEDPVVHFSDGVTRVRVGLPRVVR